MKALSFRKIPSTLLVRAFLMSVLVTTGCASQNSQPSHLGRRTAYLLGDVVVPSKGYRLCQQDTDCVIVESDCSSGCGKVSIGRRWADEFHSWIEPLCMQEWKGQMCATEACRAQSCPPLEARCKRGLCSEPEEPQIPDTDSSEVTE